MKLYSNRQVAVLVAVSVAIACACIFGTAFIIARAREPASISSVPLPGAGEAAANSGEGQAAAPQAFTPDEKENIDIYGTYNQSVVNITTETMALNYFYQPVPEKGTGSGSIIDVEGFIITNYHVIQNSISLNVTLANGKRYDAKVVGYDEQTDLAVIRIAPQAGEKLVPIAFGTSGNLKVGQKVLAIGNPFGFERTLTQGLISGLGRPIQNEAGYVIPDMIQTDASINPGNSGGPLFNSSGQMIGITTSIYTPSSGSVGIGFAIPVDTARKVVPELMRNGKVRRGSIDFQGFQLFPALVNYMRKSGMVVPVENGLLVSSVKPGSNAAKAGLKGGDTAVRYGQSVLMIGGDIVVSIDGKAIEASSDFYSALSEKKPGDSVDVEFYRGGKKMKTTVVLTESGG